MSALTQAMLRTGSKLFENGGFYDAQKVTQSTNSSFDDLISPSDVSLPCLIRTPPLTTVLVHPSMLKYWFCPVPFAHSAADDLICASISVVQSLP